MAMGTRSRGLAGSNNRPRLSVRSVYEDFKPLIESREDAEAYSVYIHLPGFLKDQIRIMAESNRRLLRVSAERIVSGNTWSRFQEEVTVPDNCDITETRAKFEGGVLRITMPKRIASVASPTELSSETTTPERSPPAPSRPVPPPQPTTLRPVVPPPSQATPAPRPLPIPAVEPRPAALRPTRTAAAEPRISSHRPPQKVAEVTRPENLPPSRMPRTEDLPPQRMSAAVPRPEALPPPRMPEPRLTPSIQTKPRDDAKLIPSPPHLPHPEAARFTPSIYPKPREDERSRLEASQKPTFPLPPPPGLLQALPQQDPAPMKDPIASERWRTESAPMRDPIASERWRTETDPAPMKDPIASERWRTETDPAPMKDPIASERWKTELDPAPMRDPIAPGRWRTESDPAPMKDPIALKRRRTESEMPKAPVITADSMAKAPMRYESLTEEEKRRFGMKGMSLRGLEEDRQLLVNMGAAVMVLVAFGAWISYSLGSSANQ
ncbi:hypothetical protein V2J09_008231 [Rumex salicifolius]